MSCRNLTFIPSNLWCRTADISCSKSLGITYNCHHWPGIGTSLFMIIIYVLNGCWHISLTCICVHNKHHEYWILCLPYFYFSTEMLWLVGAFLFWCCTFMLFCFCFNSLALGKFCWNFELVIVKPISRIDIVCISLKLSSDEYHTTLLMTAALLMISQHWFW